MKRKYKHILGKIYLVGIFWILLTILVKQIIQYDGNEVQANIAPRRLDQHTIQQNGTISKLVSVQTNATSAKKQDSTVKPTTKLVYVKTNATAAKQQSVIKPTTKSVSVKTNVLPAKILDTVKPKKEHDENDVSFWKQPLDYVPDLSETQNSDKVPYLSHKVASKYLELPNIEYKDKIAILTPLRNAEYALEQYAKQIVNLTYPHALISIYFGEDGSNDKTFEKGNQIVQQLKRRNNFAEVAALKLNISGGIHELVQVRHLKESQQYRREHIALARNRLLRFALKQNKFDYILWIDSDVAEIPPDLVQQMLFAKSDVVATSCLMRSLGYKMKYDRNSWRETNASIKQQSELEPDYLVVEGFGRSLRIALPDLKSEGRVVPLDGVGGCALMIKADCHRSGLQFPEVVYKHHIETEGLAKMARDMGYSVVGLPFVEVFHESTEK
ncbi:uncharacterized protein LOC123555092 [Mercenaria mercenaria]|uniref:uncharacterized protein LOC123555092 n=1 Tax=Mercenaria mercenaria TaxID=6596 RepID=UPI00234E6DFE|nr:uncharacterized protein LOC123555092 [Mercenaria mercenaria]